MSCSAVRARATLLLMVPIAQSQTCAASSYDKPLTTTRINASLVWRYLTSAGIIDLGRRDLRPFPAEVRNVLVVHDCEDPGLEIRAWLELMRRRQGANDGILNEIVGQIIAAAQKPREGTHARQASGELRTKFARWRVRTSSKIHPERQLTTLHPCRTFQ